MKNRQNAFENKNKNDILCEILNDKVVVIKTVC